MCKVKVEVRDVLVSLYTRWFSLPHGSEGDVMNLVPFFFNRARITIDENLQRLVVATERRKQ